MTDAVIYRPLDPAREEIRVLHVSPARGPNDPLHVDLETVSMQSSPPPVYEAISYCWGGVTGREKIMLDGQEHHTPTSAVEVLRRFRNLDRPRTLWIDAICINQNDLAERTKRVVLMGQVYSNSSHTLIWLGAADDTTKKAIVCIQHNAALLRAMLQAYQGDLQAVEADFANAKIERDPANVLAIENFFIATWFTRVWVSQEAFLSCKATCYRGSFEVPWSDVCLAAYAENGIYQADFGSGLSSGASRASLGIGKALQGLVWLERKKNEVVPCLGPFLASGQQLHATNARDYLYGLLGLPSWSQQGQSLPRWFKVDYNMPVASVLRDATRLAVAESLDLEIFEHVDSFEDRKRQAHIPGSLPSWAPTWNVPPCDRAGRFADFSTYRASGSHMVDEASINDYARPDSLILRGHEVGTVTDLLSPLKADFTTSASVFVEFGQYVLQSLGDRPLPRFGCSVIHTMTADKLQVTHSDFQVLMSDLVDWKEAGFDLHSQPFESETGGRMMIAELFMKAAKVCLMRRLLSLSSGRVGLGPLTTQVGDCIWIVYGSAVPLVLRPTAKQTSDATSESTSAARRRFQIVGQAYVSVMMHGEVIDERESAGLEPEVIELV